MSNQWKDDFTDQLCDAIVAITDRDEAYRFLEDLATFSEIKAFSQRLQVAGLLIKGFSYPQIVQATGASTATISRVKKFVEYGTDGYRDVLRKLESKKVMRGVFFPLAHGAPLPAGMAALLEGSSVWLTARSEDEISRLSEALPQGADFARRRSAASTPWSSRRRCRRRSVSSSTYRRTTLRRTPLR